MEERHKPIVLIGRERQEDQVEEEAGDMKLEAAAHGEDVARNEQKVKEKVT